MKGSPKFGSFESSEEHELKLSQQTAGETRFQTGQLSVIESEEYNEFSDSEEGGGAGGLKTLEEAEKSKKDKKGKGKKDKRGKSKTVKKTGMCSVGGKDDKACCTIF